jgi:hypothetical protein
MFRTQDAIICCLLLILTLSGCGTPEERAKKLYTRGEYSKIVEKYPDLPIARQAREQLAFGLMKKARYDDVIAGYPDLPLAWNARACKEIARGITGLNRVEVLTVDYYSVRVNVYADPSVRQSSSHDMLNEFLTTAAVRVGQWSKKAEKTIDGRVHLYVDLADCNLSPYDCSTAALLWDDDPDKARSFVAEVSKKQSVKMFVE